MKLRSPRAVARRIGKTEGALAQMRYKGTGPAYVKVGRSVMYRDEDVDAWIDSNLVQPGEG